MGRQSSVLGAWSRLRENQCRESEILSRALWHGWQGSGVSQQRCLVLGPSQMQGLEQKPRDASRVTGSRGSEWKDQPWGHRPAAPRGQEFSSHQGDCVRRAPGDTGASLQTPSMLTVCTPARCENYHSSSRGCTRASRSRPRSLRGEHTTSLSNTSGIWSKIQRIN